MSEQDLEHSQKLTAVQAAEDALSEARVALEEQRRVAADIGLKSEAAAKALATAEAGRDAAADRFTDGDSKALKDLREAAALADQQRSLVDAWRRRRAQQSAAIAEAEASCVVAEKRVWDCRLAEAQHRLVVHAGQVDELLAALADEALRLHAVADEYHGIWKEAGLPWQGPMGGWLREGTVRAAVFDGLVNVDYDMMKLGDSRWLGRASREEAEWVLGPVPTVQESLQRIFKDYALAAGQVEVAADDEPEIEGVDGEGSATELEAVA